MQVTHGKLTITEREQCRDGNRNTGHWMFSLPSTSLGTSPELWEQMVGPEHCHIDSEETLMMITLGPVQGKLGM